jgi:hypothetical protein
MPGGGCEGQPRRRDGAKTAAKEDDIVGFVMVGMRGRLHGRGRPVTVGADLGRSRRSEVVCTG